MLAVVSKAIARSVGAHVRDAAAYVCWSLARAYDPADTAPAFTLLAPALLATACYDREVRAHMRRAHVLDSRMPSPVRSTQSVSPPHAQVIVVAVVVLMPKPCFTWCVLPTDNGNATQLGTSCHRMVTAALHDSAKHTWNAKARWQERVQ